MDALLKFYTEGAAYLDTPRFLDRADQNRTLFIDEYVKDISLQDKQKMAQYLSVTKNSLKLVMIQEGSEEVISMLNGVFQLSPPKAPPQSIFVPKTSSPHYGLYEND